MSKTLLVGSTVVDVATSGEQPNWASGINAFMDAAAAAINQFAGPFDVPPQVVNIDAFNPGTPNTDITALNFPITSVRSAFIRYAVYRETNSNNAYETGTLTVVYNPDGPVNNKWEISRDCIGEGSIDFSITDNGQVQFTATAIAGTGHTGRLTIVAQAVLQSS